ncbi:MAG: hypothetical protein HYW77_02800 [Parcubacteria group bacterium]|nr:hypothetical protein [Parcubacteria group bacterium]
MIPNKIKIVLGALAVLAVVLVYLIVQSVSRNSTGVAFKITDPETTQDPTKIDSDNDGLYDREESYFNTDPYNSDTDGDGFLDGDEVTANCNPLNSTDDCPLSFGKFVESKNQAVKDTQNLTELASNLTAGAILSGDISRQNGDSDSVRTNIENLANGIAGINQKLFTIEEEINFPTSDDNSPQVVKDYIIKLSTLAEKILSVNPQFAQIQAAINPVELGVNFVKVLEGLYQEELSIIVPSSWASNHKAIIVITRKYKTLFEGIRQQNEDPLKAIFSVSMYPQLNEELKTVITDILIKISNSQLELPTNNLLFLLSLTK